jgi:hypothetical protein
MVTTFHTYPDLVTETAERKAATSWGLGASVADAVAATLLRDSQSIVLRVRSGNSQLIGFMPGGIGA